MTVESVTVSRLRRMKTDGDKIAVLTAYDATFAALLEASGVDVILVGDSLGNVIQGRDTTLPVTIDDMVYHAACVARGAAGCMRVVDMPFLSFTDPGRALDTAGRLMQEGGAGMVKLEGGSAVTATVDRLATSGIPVCGHLGLLPQSVHKLGGFRVQGRSSAEADRILADARALADAGADMLVLEAVPAALGAEVTRSVDIPVIGIGAGADCDGQVLVLHDMLGLTPEPRPRFTRDFLADAGDVPGAVRAYVEAVKAGRFPGVEHGF